ILYLCVKAIVVKVAELEIKDRCPELERGAYSIPLDRNPACPLAGNQFKMSLDRRVHVQVESCRSLINTQPRSLLGDNAIEEGQGMCDEPLYRLKTYKFPGFIITLNLYRVIYFRPHAPVDLLGQGAVEVDPRVFRVRHGHACAEG